MTATGNHNVSAVAAAGRCVECGVEGGHLNGCSRDHSRPRPQPALPASIKGKTGANVGFGSRKGKVCSSCGNRVGVPETRHKEDCPEFIGSISSTDRGTWKIAISSADPYVPPPNGGTACDVPDVEPTTVNQRSQEAPPVRHHPRAVLPDAAALKILRGPLTSRNVIRSLKMLSEDDLRWVLDALFRIVRGSRSRTGVPDDAGHTDC